MTERRMTLTMFMAAFGYANDAWRHPRSRTADIGSLAHARDMAQAAERAGLDAIFFADSNDASGLRRHGYRGVSVNEPVSTIGALIGFTERIGMIGTASTTWSEPFTVARQFGNLDQLSGGRAGWNIVTSVSGNQNFGRDEMPDPAARYDRAMEFVDVVIKLWESWDRDAIVNDKENGNWVDNERVHDIDHVGVHFRVKGPTNIPRSPQDRPVLVQAGQSPAGIELGSTYGDLIYAVQPEKAGAVAWYADYKQRVAEKGRDPEKVKILPGIIPIVGRTQAEAEELAAELDACVTETTGRALVSGLLDVDLSDIELNERIPQERLVDNPRRMERWRLFRDMAQELTLRQLMIRMSRSTGHQSLVGTPASIAERMIDWFDARACDGFNFDPPNVTEGMGNMLELLVPELQERGYFPAEHHGDTFRERAGLTLFTPREADARPAVLA
ncbi:NtaA/DmoA family FMN-dependent monooxygenase [Microbacterium album]|uniref:Monooxygenase n=1 Tax=Microbacterium album TaxID=2053191 RepID=A0A917MMC3_9MICO|nr:NtaA/DmoA family FMN-dependent monooxygenase [Microbacterium album]GGH47909.1 monooxygenase [Microbacterium album]